MIRFDDVSKTYPDGTQAVRGLSLDVRDGETLILLGSSGCGKTTTLKMINRLIETTEGRIEVGGRDVASSIRWSCDARSATCSRASGSSPT